MSLKKRIACILCALCTIALAFPAFGFAMAGDAEVGRNGKATVKLTVQSELGETEFREKLDAYVEDYCVASSFATASRTSIVVDKVEKTDSGYDVTVHTRRIDKITASCIMDYTDASDYAVEESSERRTIENWAKGNYAATVNGNIQIARPDGSIGINKGNDAAKLKYDGSKIAAKIKDASGERADDELFFADLAKQKDTVKMFTFFFVNVDGLTDVTVKLPGKIKYYAGNNAELIDENTIKFVTTTVKAKIGASELGAEPEYKDATMFAGWATVDTGTSPLVIALAVAAAVIVGGGIAAFCIHIVKIGKQAIAKEEDRK